MAWAAAMPWIISGASALLGGIAGRKSAKDSGKPTITRNTPMAPPDQLGGYGRLNEVLNRVRDAPQYRVGADNPYLSGGMSHIFGRAGVQAPSGGYGNPYLGGMSQQQRQGGGQAQPQKPWYETIPPEILKRLVDQLGGQEGIRTAVNNNPNIPSGGGF